MTQALSRLKRFLTAPLWSEHSEQAARRRFRTIVGVPFAALAGIAWGVGSAPSIAGGTALYWSALAAVSLACFVYAEQRVVPPLAEAAVSRWRLGGRWGVIALETLAVGGLILLLTRVVGVPNAPGVEIALGFGAAYAAGMELLLGSVPQGLVHLLRAGGASRRLVTPDHSRIDTLVSQGDLQGAAELCMSALESQPRAASLYLRLYRIRVAQRDYDAALAALQAGYRTATLPPKQEEFVVHQMYELCATKLNDPTLGAQHVAEWLEHRTGEPPPEWATRALDEAVDDTSSREDTPTDAPAPLDIPPEAFSVESQQRFELPGEFEVPQAHRPGADFELGGGAYGPFWKPSAYDGNPDESEGADPEDA